MFQSVSCAFTSRLDQRLRLIIMFDIIQAQHAESIIATAQHFKIAAQVIGHVEKSETGKKHVVVHSPHGVFRYE